MLLGTQGRTLPTVDGGCSAASLVVLYSLEQTSLTTRKVGTKSYHRFVLMLWPPRWKGIDQLDYATSSEAHREPPRPCARGNCNCKSFSAREDKSVLQWVSKIPF